MSESSAPTDWSLNVWGCRGSVTVSSADTVRYGGLTTCLELDLPHARIIVDAGSGLADLGRRKASDGKPTLMLFSHLHWDHIVGFPHFTHLFVPGWDLHVRGVKRDGTSVLDAIMGMNRPPIFPVELGATAQCNVDHKELALEGELNFHGVRVRWREVAHPGGCSAYSFEVGGKKIVFTGDVEIPQMNASKFAEFARDADHLICDAQYTPEEYHSHIGWGHSTYEHASALAREANAGTLWLTHHDPRHNDDFLDDLVTASQKLFPKTRGAFAGAKIDRKS